MLKLNCIISKQGEFFNSYYKLVEISYDKRVLKYKTNLFGNNDFKESLIYQSVLNENGTFSLIHQHLKGLNERILQLKDVEKTLAFAEKHGLQRIH